MTRLWRWDFDGGRPAPGASGSGTDDRKRRIRIRRQRATGALALAVLPYTPFVKEGGDRGHHIALTFDDGPGPYTPGVPSVLEHFHVHATFFEIGKMLRYFNASTLPSSLRGD